MANEMKRAVIISGAPYNDFYFIKENIYPDDFVICADRGVQTAKTAGVRVDMALGDFDTVEAPSDACCELIKLPSEKDVTDTYYACEKAVELGFKNVVIFCALGGRADHTFANYLCLNFLCDAGVNAKILDRKNCIMIVKDNLSIKRSGYKYLSVFPFISDVKSLTLSGVKYPLDKHDLPASSPLGVSNEIISPFADITFEDGKLLIILSND